jgi:pimeloyl-ACP methyl ester carboxylesterase
LLYYYESGFADAPAIVFLHGGGVSGWSWLPQVRSLPDYHCIIPDLPGHGRSTADGAVRIDAAAEEVAILIKEKVPDRRVHVVGLSMGGQIALQLLSTHPDLVDRVVVSGTNTSPSGSIRMFAPLLKFIMILYAPFQNADLLVKANMDQYKVPHEFESEFRVDTRLITPDLYTQIVVESMTYPLPPLADASGLLVACGEKEPELIKKSARMIRATSPGVPCVVAPGVGHNWGMENPELFTAMVRAWVEHTPLPGELQQLQ